MTTKQNAVIDSSKRFVLGNITGGHRRPIHLTLRRIINQGLPYYKSNSLSNIVKVVALGVSGSFGGRPTLLL